MVERKIVSRRIEYLRKEILFLTQTDFAVLLGLDPKKGRSTVNNWEQGAIQVKSDDLFKIACCCGNISVDWLLGLSDTPFKTEEIQRIHAVTGLSGKAIGKLKNIRQGKDADAFPRIISALIEDGNAEFFLSLLYSLINLSSQTENSNIEIEIDGRELSMSPYHHLVAIFQTLIIENIPSISKIYKELEH